ncbi:MAG: tetratricopeptide (TPR) repeat protein [Planctomycetota bacterium]|jgi:tetratricopeptide (TPR) repeat protein
MTIEQTRGSFKALSILLLLLVLLGCAWKFGRESSTSEDEQQATYGKGEFNADYSHIQSSAFKAESVDDRISFYRELLSSAQAIEAYFPLNFENRAAFVVAKCARTLLDEGDVVGALSLIREGRDQWQDSSLDWQATLKFWEGRALRRVGVLDKAEVLFNEATAQMDEVLASRGEINLGGYFNSYNAYIDSRILDGRAGEALRILDRLDAGVDWTWVEEKIGSKRTLKNRARLAALRGEVLAAIGTTESREKSKAAFSEMKQMSGVSPAVLFSADAALISLRLIENPSADLQDLVVSMEEHWSSYEANGIEQGPWGKLVMDTAQVRAATNDQKDQALADLRTTIGALVDFTRGNILNSGVAATQLKQYRAAIELLLQASEPGEIAALLLELQATGRVWSALDRPHPRILDVTRLLCTESSGVLIYLRGEFEDRWIALDQEGLGSIYPVPLLDKWFAAKLDHEADLLTFPGDLSVGQTRARSLRLKESGEQLAHSLFPQELRNQLALWSRVYVVGRDELFGLSLEALPLDDGVPFGCSHAVIDLPCLPVVPKLAQRADMGDDDRGIRLVADSLVPKSVVQRYGIAARLELTKSSLMAELGLGSGSLAQLFMHKQATQEAMRRGSGEGVLHLIVHGVIDPYRDLSILLALTPDKLTPDGLSGVESVRAGACAPLVLLSVCSSADSAPRGGDPGANHLGGAFIEAGAHTVVLSPGEVRLDATLLFYRAFYEGRARGVSSAEATREARVALRQDSRFTDPFFWGQLRVFGIGR